MSALALPSVAECLKSLDRIEASVEQALALATQFPAFPPPTGTPAAITEPLRRLDERLAALHDRLQQAEHAAATADDLLAAEARALADWQAGLAAVRQKM